MGYDAGTILGVQWYVGKSEPKDGDTEFHHRSGGDYAFRSCGSPFPMYLWTLGVSAQKKHSIWGRDGGWDSAGTALRDKRVIEKGIPKDKDTKFRHRSGGDFAS